MIAARRDRPEAIVSARAARIVLGLSCAAVLIGCAPDPYARVRDTSLPEVERAVLLDARLRGLLGFAGESSAWLESVDSVGRILSKRIPAGASLDERTRILADWFSGPEGVAAVLAPDDTDLVPSLAWDRRRGGCTSLAFLWRRLGSLVDLPLDPVLLPGHVALRRRDGVLVEPLRGGLIRSAEFYDSAFDLASRPGYRLDTAWPEGVVGALAMHAGLLEWKRGDEAAAGKAFQAAVELVPGLPEAEGNLGLLRESLGDRDAARAHLERALAGDPANRAAQDRLAALRESKGRGWMANVVEWYAGTGAQAEVER